MPSRSVTFIHGSILLIYLKTICCMLWNQGGKNNYRNLILPVLLVSLVSLAFSIRFLNSLSSILLVAIVLIHPQRKTFITQAFTNYFFLSLLALFVLQIAGLLYANDTAHGWKEVTKKAGMVAIPFFFCGVRHISGRNICMAMVAFSISLAAACLYCLLHATILYLQDHDASVFFYHTLLVPFDQHAIFFSFFLFYCIVYWMEEGSSYLPSKYKGWLTALILFFVVMIVLLSSKLVIGITLLYMLYFIFKRWKERTGKRPALAALIVIVVSVSLVMLTKNPVRERFADMNLSKHSIFTQQSFAPHMYFNGLEFRLLTWRFSYEILNEKKAWLLGVSPGDAQHELNRKYKEMNMYLGDN